MFVLPTSMFLFHYKGFMVDECQVHCRRLVVWALNHAIQMIFWHSFSNFHGTYVQMKSLKAPENYSASFWSHTISVLLCEGPKPNISMISGFLSRGEPLYMDLNIPKYFKTYKRNMGTFFKHIIFIKHTFWDINTFCNFGPDLEKMGTEQ